MNKTLTILVGMTVLVFSVAGAIAQANQADLHMRPGASADADLI